MATAIHTEKAFEEALEHHLVTAGGYHTLPAEFYDPATALFPTEVLAFLQKTQPQAWLKTEKAHGAQAAVKLLQRLHKELELRGPLDVLRNGITDFGVKYQLAYFQPETNLNPDTERLYGLNRLGFTRQLYYSKQNKKSLDVVLSLNGIPLTTLELKNHLTGQTVRHAQHQYKHDRDPQELLFQFSRRALVHFAVDPDEVYMTTRLSGTKTRFLPFNKGNNNGAGNPPNPSGYRTAYLWEEVLTKDVFLDIVGRFLHVQTEKIKTQDGKILEKHSLIFPRYHQLDAVRRLGSHARSQGAGHNYLIQHSAGSGKSNSIAWLAYRLSCLHNAQAERVFDSVIVITDRRVLDQQLQETIFQFEHKQGVVQKIEKDSNQLAAALQAGTNIIITTLQKFPFVVKKVAGLPKRRYAVIVDEAHSSQSGEGVTKMKQVLTGRTLEQAAADEADDNTSDDTAEDNIRKVMESRGKQPNLSFFAFTATPKPKTLQVFGQPTAEGKHKPFHLYSMRQAIEEGFILDVLRNYTSYETYYRVSKAIEDDPELNKKKAASAIGRFVSLHPHNLAQKTEVMIEHFRQVVRHKIGGKAKAMVVTGSRLHAVRYKQEFDRYIKLKGYTDMKTLVAFSGKVVDEHGLEYTEPKMNGGIGEKALPEEFNTGEYQVLIVADKYQTGFDQPLLHTMYVDKKLSGVKAVQTLSRLNRTSPGKEDTFVLDFANDLETILDSFQPYYEVTYLKESPDPNLLYDLKARLELRNVIYTEEVEAFAQVYFKSASTLTPTDQGKLNGFLDPAVQRYSYIVDEEAKDGFKHTLTSFTRLYAYLSQVMPFTDADLEKLFAYGRLLLTKLPASRDLESFVLNDEVALEYYRLQKVGTTSIEPEKGQTSELDPTTEAGLRKAKEEKERLSAIIHVLNERFGTEFDDADKLLFDQIEKDLVSNALLSKQAQSNTIENFKFGFDDMYRQFLLERRDQNEEIFNRLFADKDFGGMVQEWMLKRVYDTLRKSPPAP
ncbi:type I restriction endonuclease subunit R [Microvirga sp. STR05]|uniref:Type I restriction endonuclease subunit R n=1 Tax=Hymenobacter duratus TaxID=2771356 RepID=A0ABR8JGV7_9BACT|nr:type I restriction endonuclease [Hymenobacter duratus]MBD2716076.1 type I restriction endonuclease subunit R [Hymenobacter duratus]MBR7950990.1 type I restriction endonuclease subunit R [Microvirga sp. STR05]